MTLANPLPVAIQGTATTSAVGDVVCYITDRCSYNVVLVSAGPPAEHKLQWSKQGTRDIVNDITNPRPFSIPPTPAGALYYRFVAAIDLSTSDPSLQQAWLQISQHPAQRTGPLQITTHYLSMKTSPLRKQSGSSLVVVMAVLATLMVIVAVAAEYTSTVNRQVQRSNSLQNAVAIGDSCIEILFANWRSTCSSPVNSTIPQKTTNFTSIPLPTASQFNLPAVANFAVRGASFDPANDEYDPNYIISNYKVVAVTPEWNTLSAANATPIPMLGQINTTVPSLDPLINPKIKTTPLFYNYVASADVTLPGLDRPATWSRKCGACFKNSSFPWNFAIFYADPLEIHPGAPFTVTGWVHTNSDLYTGHDYLTFADKVTYASDWFVDFMPGETSHNGETPQPPHYPGNLPPARDQALQPFGLDSTSIFNTSDANPNNDSYRELIEPPKSGYTDPMASQRYWDQADVVIEIKDNPVATNPGFDGVKGHDLVTIGTPNSDGTITSLNTSGKLLQHVQGCHYHERRYPGQPRGGRYSSLHPRH